MAKRTAAPKPPKTLADERAEQAEKDLERAFPDGHPGAHGIERAVDGLIQGEPLVPLKSTAEQFDELAELLGNALHAPPASLSAIITDARMRLAVLRHALGL